MKLNVVQRAETQRLGRAQSRDKKDKAGCLRGGTFKGKNPSPIEASTSARLLSIVVCPLKLDKLILAISIIVRDILSDINSNSYIN
jgi:hypothetical protein